MAQLLLIRHGQSTWNALRRWQGHADPPLSDLGIAQARRAGRRLANELNESSTSFDAVWSSDLERAHATARTIIDVLGGPSITTHRGLRERAAGAWEGLTRDEIDEGWPGWIDTFERPAGFEDDAALLLRLLPTLAEIAENSDRALAVAHGGVIRALDRHFGGPDEGVANLAGRWLEGRGDDWTIGPAVDLAAGAVTDVE